MICKICHKNETDSTSGICWKCITKNLNTSMIKGNPDNFNPLEYAFRNWLEKFEVCQTERWDKLSIDERDVLLEHYWGEFLKKYEEILKTHLKNKIKK